MKYLRIYSVLIIVLTATGCSTKSQNEVNAETEPKINTHQFELITNENPRGPEFNEYITTVYDKHTKVMYSYTSYNETSSLTPLYNADGSLRIYSEE